MPTTIPLLILLFTLLALWHEWGHYLVARAMGCQVPRVQVGFGHTLLEWRMGATTWAMGWLPLGGYTRIHGMHRHDKHTQPNGPRQHYRYDLRPAQRVAIALAGPAMNLLAGLLLLALAAMLRGQGAMQGVLAAPELLHVLLAAWHSALGDAPTTTPLLDGTLAGALHTAALISLVLALVNLLPLGRSDGARIVANLAGKPEPA
jgi:membrane-associated protease RseP (regulator of RpoE activity)